MWPCNIEIIRSEDQKIRRSEDQKIRRSEDQRPWDYENHVTHTQRLWDSETHSCEIMWLWSWDHVSRRPWVWIIKTMWPWDIEIMCHWDHGSVWHSERAREWRRWSENTNVDQLSLTLHTHNNHPLSIHSPSTLHPLSIHSLSNVHEILTLPPITDGDQGWLPWASHHPVVLISHDNHQPC